jgi:nicotinate phosphoribosyltransferase
MMLNHLTTQTTLATNAARIQHAARGRAVLDFALRRAQGVDAGMKLVRACRIAGLAGTSNVAGSATYGLAASGTMAHALIQSFEREIDAFRAFASRFGDGTVLLVDTYDTLAGVENAIVVARAMHQSGHRLGGIRLDSGDLADLAHRSRAMLDDAGLPDVAIYASGGLDERSIDVLLGEQHAPIDGFGVGSSLGVSDDAPVLNSVYKLVAVDGRLVQVPRGDVDPADPTISFIPDGALAMAVLARDQGRTQPCGRWWHVASQVGAAVATPPADGTKS